VLRSISETVRQQNIRETDLLGRWGGEEFLIICVNTEKAAAGALAEKIRTRLALMEHAGVGSVTASFGVTEYAENDTNESIIERVDAAMYDAKHRGRNRTSVF
jgi:diguanylate cyclase (GGDEF)-like protein